MGSSWLLLPVPEVDWFVRPRVARDHPEMLAHDPDVSMAHLTLLGPFAPPSEIDDGLLGELTEFFGEVVPFEFRLVAVAVLPDGVPYLAPSPTRTFRRLIRDLADRFPEYPPYGGALALSEVVPHVSVSVPPEPEPVDPILAEVGPRLPVTAHAREAVLYWCEPHASRVLATFPFGTSAA